MIIGLILAVIAGALVGTQNIFNRHLNVEISGWPATAFILITGSIASLVLGLIIEGIAIFNFENMRLSFWFFGLTGIGVIYCIMQGMKRLGPTTAVIISVIAQLVSSLVFDTVGLLSLPATPIKYLDIIGLICMVVGIVIFTSGKKEKV